MKVVALQQGLYDGLVREVGDAFVLADPAAFSKRWMAKADSAEAKRVLREQGRTTVTVSDDEIAAEVASATGKTDALRKAENAKLSARGKELEAELAVLKAAKPAEKAAAAEPAQSGEKTAEEREADAEAAAIAAGEGTADEGDAPKRVTRRTRA